MQVKWTVEMFGRQVGQVEDLDEKTEPKLPMWLKAGVVKPAEESPAELQPGELVIPSKRERATGPSREE